MTEVVAALIANGDRFLICRRPENKSRALLWEFPGGKIEPGETPEAALERECMEELGIRTKVHSLYAEAVHDYPDISIRLLLYRTEILSGTPVALEHAELRWIAPEDIPQFAFCPADMPFAGELLNSGL
ncbi:MAG: (deoxy)nucleoside triphosphate pyrophosphohydrolase [Clostridia bacterium]|nr:(deoxy)nucleoside triphosphate pyrophosphohydrolase [Clostridia bacterium]